MKPPFEFATATRLIFGAGTIREAGPLAKTFGRRVLVVTGRDPGRAERLLAGLRDHALEVIPFCGTGEPDVPTVVKGVQLGKEQAVEVVVGFGGGSALDTAKAIAAMLTNDGELLDFLEVIGKGKILTRPSAPFIAIPTTAGTGSEVTRNAVLASPEHRVKVSLRSPFMLPKVAIIDPELTFDLPPALSASTGLDALTQVIEPYVSCRANPITDSFCVEGIRRAGRSLHLVCTEGRHPEAREDMSVASLFGGFALANAGLGAVHGFAGPVGGMFCAPHGAICAAILPHVMEVNLLALRERDPQSNSLQRYDEIGRILTGNPGAGADDGVEWVVRLVKELRVPGLSAYGIQEAHVEELVEKSAKASSMKANPIVLTRDELTRILKSSL